MGNRTKLVNSSIVDILTSSGPRCEAVIFYDSKESKFSIPDVIGANYNNVLTFPSKKISLNGLWIDKTAYIVDVLEHKIIKIPGYSTLKVDTDKIPTATQYIMENGKPEDLLEEFLKNNYSIINY